MTTTYDYHYPTLEDLPEHLRVIVQTDQEQEKQVVNLQKKIEEAELLLQHLKQQLNSTRHTITCNHRHFLTAIEHREDERDIFWCDVCSRVWTVE
jgi:hypothetical protein